MACGCTEQRLAPTRWQEAQAAEREYWYATDPVTQMRRREEERLRAAWIADLLGITPETVAGRTVLDIGGGPQPIVAWSSLALARRVLVDPMPLNPEDAAALAHVSRATVPAEDYVGPEMDEAWGYNVLQHVQCPALVLATAKRQARTVRWFEWVHQPTSVVHPHVITADTFRAFDGWRCVTRHEGKRDEGRGWAQAYIAGVWERI